MKLEYLYDNNNNIKYTLKVISLSGVIITFLVSLFIFYVENKVDYSLAFGILMAVLGVGLIYSITIALANNYKKKQSIKIKGDGKYLEGTVVMANYHLKPTPLTGKRYGWLTKASGDITVMANNEMFKITDIDYNKAFKNLIKNLRECVNNNYPNDIDVNENLEKEGTLKKITIGIYVLDKKAVADLDSIKLNY